MSGLEIRIVGPECEASLASFFKGLQAAGTGSEFHPHPLTPEAARDRATYAGDDLYYVLVDNTAVIGYGLLRGWDAGYDVPSLGIALLPQVRGKGFGRMFMAFLHSAARRRGAKEIRLKVYRSNIPALALYRSLGYRFQGLEDNQLVGYLDL